MQLARTIRRIIYFHLWNTYKEFYDNWSSQDINKFVAEDYQLLMSNIEEIEEVEQENLKTTITIFKCKECNKETIFGAYCSEYCFDHARSKKRSKR